MARCLDCGKRLFPVINNRRCGPCLEARARVDAEERYATALRRRDELNARGLLRRVLYGAPRGALLGLWYVTMLFLTVAAIFADSPGGGGGPDRGVRHVNWPYIGLWLALSLLGAIVVLIAGLVRGWQAGPAWAALVPVVVAVLLGAWFGAGRAAAREWGWWLDLDPPPHLANPDPAA